ncbi:hypothetical protein [Streptomyces sp. CBMA123]|uniref:Rv0361 family membrane protein n=1 Tax=Streptomyces sp. CBMA123 TaxID=1896313 RepID=UPI001661C4BE|nr:hypothetical protein [Streptomyces sp. CBMA123]MBD0692142.1 hypothetical protein [Streptomyces sp. CBMA123]
MTQDPFWPPAPTSPPEIPRRVPRKRWPYLLGVAVLLLVAAGVVGYVEKDRAPGEPDRVRQVADRFAGAVDRGDVAASVGMLCAEEAGDLADDGLPSGEASPSADEQQPGASGPPVEISDVRIQGDVASVHVTRPGVDTTLYLRKEAGVWSVCAPAAARLPATASPRP